MGDRKELELDWKRALQKLEDAHLILDSFGIPRGNLNLLDPDYQRLTVAGRLEWLLQMIPDLSDQVEQAKQRL